MKILRGGQLEEVDVLSGPGNPELIKFPEPLGELEVYSCSRGHYPVYSIYNELTVAEVVFPSRLT